MYAWWLLKLTVWLKSLVLCLQNIVLVWYMRSIMQPMCVYSIYRWNSLITMLVLMWHCYQQLSCKWSTTCFTMVVLKLAGHLYPICQLFTKQVLSQRMIGKTRVKTKICQLMRMLLHFSFWLNRILLGCVTENTITM